MRSPARLDARVWDAVVVGGGPAGLLVTERLHSSGCRTLLVDCGPRRSNQVDAADPRWRFRTIGGRAEWPRAYGLGGRLLLWGGWLSRFGPHVFRKASWPYQSSTLSGDYASVERWLRARTAKHIAATHRKAARTLGVRILPVRRATRGIKAESEWGRWWERETTAAEHARFDSVASTIEWSRDRAESVTIIDAEHNVHRVRTKALILAASPIETCRILLASDIERGRVGRGLSDHFPMSYILVEPGNASADYKGAFIPSFVNVDPKSRRAYRGGFSLEIIGPMASSQFAFLGETLESFGTHDIQCTLLSAIGEVMPDTRRFVDLAPRARDQFGRPVPQIHSFSDEHEHALISDMRTACRSFAETIARPGAALIEWRNPIQPRILFHPTGGCAMGTKPDSICDEWGRLRRLRNVWVADASVFPSAGDCHPTATVLAHALRVARSVVRALA